MNLNIGIVKRCAAAGNHFSSKCTYFWQVFANLPERRYDPCSDEPAAGTKDSQHGPNNGNINVIGDPLSYPMNWGKWTAHPHAADEKLKDVGGEIKDCVYKRKDNGDDGSIECANGKAKCSKDHSGKNDGKTSCKVKDGEKEFHALSLCTFEPGGDGQKTESSKGPAPTSSKSKEPSPTPSPSHTPESSGPPKKQRINIGLLIQCVNVAGQQAGGTLGCILSWRAYSSHPDHKYDP